MSGIAPPPSVALQLEVSSTKSTRNNYRFSLVELCDIFSTTRPTLRKRIGDIKPTPDTSRISKVYDLADVAALVDVRKVDLTLDWDSGKENTLPENASPQLRQLFHKARDAEVTADLKELKYNTEKSLLLPAAEVEREIANAFKVVARLLDNMPDILERGGIINRLQVNKVTRIVDKARTQLAEDMSKFSPDLED